jgi:hypothetical protein
LHNIEDAPPARYLMELAVTGNKVPICIECLSWWIQGIALDGQFADEKESQPVRIVLI